MTDRNLPPVSNDDVHAYVDGQLPSELREHVERYLASHPELAADVAEWTLLNEQIKALVADTDAPPVRVESVSKRRTWLTPAWATAAGFALFLLGAASGGVASLNFLSSEATKNQVATLSASSQTNFLVYASDIRHPIEVGAEQKEHMLSWLSKRLGEKVVAPDITDEGFTLIGGRLVAYAEKPAALIMYENPKGERLTLMIGHNENNRDTGFRFSDQGNIQTLYWIDGPLGYALSASIGRDRLQSVAHSLNRQL
ncbi:MAG: anti-sigma factor family protein [Blastocatellia bacterium]